MLTKNEIIDYSKRVLDNYFNSQYSATANTNLLEIPDKYDDDRPNRFLFHKVNEEIVSLHQELYSTFGEKRTNITDTFPHKYLGLTIPDNLGYHNLVIGTTYYLTINNDTLAFSLTAGETQWQSLINKLNTLTEEFSEAITIATVDGGTNRITVSGASFDNSYLNKFIIKDSTGVNKYVHRIKSIINSTTLELESVTNLSNSDAAIIYLDQKYVFSYDSQDIKVETNLNNTDYTEPRIIIKENEYEDDLVIALGCDLTKDIYNADDTSDVWIYGAKLEPADASINTPYNMFHKNIFIDNTGGLIKTPLQCKESNGQVATYLTLSERDTVTKLNTFLTYLLSGYAYSAVTPITLAVQPIDVDNKIFYKTTASISADLSNFNNNWVIVSDGADLQLLKVVETKSDTAPDPDEYFFRFESTDYIPTSLLGTLTGFSEGDCQDLTPTDANLILLKSEINDLILSLKNKYLYVKDAILRKENAFDSDNADYLVSIYQAYLTTDKWLNAAQETIDIRYTFSTYLGPVLSAVQARDTLLNARLAYIKTTGGYGELGLASIVGDVGDDGSEETWIASQTGIPETGTGGGGEGSTTTSYLSVELLRKELISAQNEYAPLIADGNFNNVTQSIIDDYDASYSTFVNYLQEVLSDPFTFGSDDSQEFQDTFTDYIEKKKALSDAIAFKSKTLEESNKLETLEQEQAQALATYNESVNSYFLSDEIKEDLELAYREYNSLSNEIIISDINGLIISNTSITFTSDYIGRIVYKQGTTNKGITNFSGMTLTLDSVAGLSIGDTIEIHYSPMGSSNVLADKLEDIIASGSITSEDRVLISTLTSNNNAASIDLTSASQNAVNDIFRNLQVADEELLTNSILTPEIEITDFNSSVNVSIKTIGRDVQIFFNYANVVSSTHPEYFVYGYQIQGRAKTWNNSGTVYDGINWYPLLNNDYANYAQNDGGLNTIDGITKATTSLTPFLMHKYLPIAGTLLNPLNRTIYYRFRKIIKTSTNDSIVGYSAWTTGNYEATIYPDQTGISGDTWIKLNDHEHPPIDDLIVATSRNLYELGYTTHYIDISFNKTPENSIDQVGTKGYYIYRSTTRSGTPGNYTYPDQEIITTVLDDKPYMSDYPSYPSGREFVYTDLTTINGITYYYGVSAFDHNDNVSDVIWCENSITAYNNITPDTIDVIDIKMNLADIGTKGFFRIHFEIPITKRVSIKEISITRRVGTVNQTTVIYPFTQAIYEGLNGSNEKYYIDDSSYWDSFDQNSSSWWKEYSFFKTGDVNYTNFVIVPKSIYNNVIGPSTNTLNADLSEAIIGYTYNMIFTSTINVEAKRGLFELTFDEATSRRLKYYVILRKKYNDPDYYPVGIANAEETSVFYSDSLLQYVDKTDPEITGILYKVTAYNDYGISATTGPNSTVGVSSFINYRPQPVVILTKSIKWIDNRIEVQFNNSVAIDTATLEVEKYKIYYSDDGGTNKYPISYNNKILTKDKDEILKNSGGVNSVHYYQNVNNMYLSSEADSILFYVKSITGVGASSLYKDLTNPLTEIDIEADYTTNIIDTQVATLAITINRDKINFVWPAPLMFNNSNVSYVIEEYNGSIWTQIFTTGNNENTYFYNTPNTFREPEEFNTYNWRISAIVNNITYASKEATTITNDFLSYTPIATGLVDPYAYAENKAIYVELPNAYNFIDDYTYYLYQSKTYWNGTSIISNGTVSSVSGNLKDIMVSSTLGMEVRNRLYINGKFYKVEVINGTTITLETNVGISATQKFYIFELVYTGQEELVKLPVVESDESNWFKNWSYGYEVRSIYGYSNYSSIVYPVVITNWSDNDNLGTNLLAYYNMDMFDTILLDNSGNGYNGTNTGVTMNTGIINGSAYFDGSSYISLGDVLDITGAFTWACWFKTTTTGTAQSLICKDSGGGNRGPWLQLLDTTGALQFTISGDGTSFTTANDTTLDYGDNIWHFVVGIFIPSTSLSLYIDGKLRAYNTTSIPAAQFNSAAKLNFGRRPNNSLFLTGNLDEIRIYDRALSEAEVTKLYTSGKELSNSQNLDKYVIIRTSNSNFGYRANDILLSAYVYEESVDITNGIPASKFRWKRNSACSTCDTIWNNAYNGCKNALADNIDYYARNASYSVEVLD